MVKSMARQVHRKGVGFAASLAIIAVAIAAQANAACMDTKSLMPTMLGAVGAARLVPAVYRPDTLRGAGLLAVSDSDDEGSSLVGLWQVTTTGIAADYGTQSFHPDGTELLFSGAQNPETGDVCQGVWRKVGPNTYTVNHIAMGWIAPGAGFGIRVHLHMILTLNSRGDSFSGTYKAAVYSVSPADPFDESVQVAAGGGTVSATRVKPD